ncbi:urease accessory protein UreD [Patulibacter defluvii]|uniref:urease accessory protein UreD n=1 Tax=Patulibacter defluvii TaxID=3095358 RepID=UPI002A75E009|nr:urease accessory protein UreD [Patulibacter sp. DM4]
MTNPSGGLLGGDRLETAIEAGPGTAVSIATQGATRVYRAGDGPPTVLTTTVAVGAAARVEWIPHHLMPYAGAAVHQRTRVDVAASGALLAWEVLCAGRSAHGERFAWRALDTRLRVVRDGRPLLTDGAVLAAGGEPFDGADLAATVVVVLPRTANGGAALAIRDDPAAALADDLHRTLAGRRGLLAGASAPAPGLVVARLLARDAPALYAGLHALRQPARAALGLPPAERPVA